MKNLIKEIERVIQALKDERQKCFEEIDYPLSQVDKLEGRILAYKDVLNVFKDYNLITAPKSIKLSEIVNKLTKDFPAHNFYYRYDTKWIAIWLGNHCYATFAIKDNKLVLENKDEFEYPKWIYALWIAGTIVEDDLKEVE